jgi:phosphatidylinositol-4,5-bisphosphate 3-kinase
MKKKFVLGSSSIQIYDEHGIMKTGLQEVYIWPFWENDLKIPFSTPFHFKKSTFITDKENFDKRNYGIIHVEFPKFPNNLINTYKTPHSYSEFLRIKNSHSDKKTKYDHPEFKKFYGDTISSTEKIFKDIYKSYLNDFNSNNVDKSNDDKSNDDSSNNFNNKDEKTEDEDSTFLNGKNFFEKLLQIFLIEPLKEINDKNRQRLINARDYISTIPSKLEIFLRCINWFDPIQAYIAKIYIKKWARIEPIDAVGLLDSRFINTYVREYALSILNEGTDDIKDLYLLQIIYAQMNDCYLEGHLTDFIIENSLRSHYFASKFIFMSKLLKDNPLFFERISIITAQIFMLSGTKLILEVNKTKDCSTVFSCASIRGKEKKKNDVPKDELTKQLKEELSQLFFTKEKEKKEKEEKVNLKYYENAENNKSNSNINSGNDDIETTRENHYNSLSPKTLLDVKIPVFPGFFFSEIKFNSLKAYDSKMVPMEYALYPSEGNFFEEIELKKLEEKYQDKPKVQNKICRDMRIFYKNGDDLRQDHLALLALRTMDILWLENDLDLKVFGYSVLPTGVKDGFLEKCNATPYNDVQTGKTLTGIFDRELIKKYFDKKAKEIVEKEIVGNPRSVDEIKSQQTDNFVRSLAGYCVGTCVLGIADRHSDNIMIQDNGIFLHIDYGHILGNFKQKFGINREKSKFVLDQTMVNFCKQVNMEEDFKNFCVKAYNILRKNSNRLLNLLMVLSSSGMPELYCIPNISYFIENLKLDKKNDEDAGNYFLCLINQSKNDKYRYFDNIFHNLNHIKIGGNKKGGDDNKGFFKKYFGCLKKDKNKGGKNSITTHKVIKNGTSVEVKKN